jgi:hypothetical protein
MTAKALKLNSIAEEAAACRKVFKGFKIGGFVLHCHHQMVGETLNEDAENRIAYILSSKPEHERALRLHLFRPVLEKKLKADAEWQKADAEWQKADAEWQKAYAEWQKAYAEWQKVDARLGELIHAKFCVAGCPWDGHTIFPKG